jgi:hypothetical protein
VKELEISREIKGKERQSFVLRVCVCVKEREREGGRERGRVCVCV